MEIKHIKVMLFLHLKMFFIHAKILNLRLFLHLQTIVYLLNMLLINVPLFII
jgi:hypothetical protein